MEYEHNWINFDVLKTLPATVCEKEGEKDIANRHATLQVHKDGWNQCKTLPGFLALKPFTKKHVHLLVVISLPEERWYTVLLSVVKLVYSLLADQLKCDKGEELLPSMLLSALLCELLKKACPLHTELTNRLMTPHKPTMNRSSLHKISFIFYYVSHDKIN